MFTQPQMYTAIARKEPVFKMYCKQLLDEGVVTQEDVDALSKRVLTEMQTKLDQVSTPCLANPAVVSWGVLLPLPACLRCALSRATVEDL